ncbi:MAG: hypothetical protein FWH03_02650 [Firmicutes bacterium]|nr:hypothetical protein [Bacillota bacterium]
MGGDFNNITDMINELYRQLWGPLLGVFLGAAGLLGLWIGLKFVFAGGDEQKVKKAKEQVKYFVIGIVAIFVITAILPLVIAAFMNWAR